MEKQTYNHLSSEERDKIAVLRAQGLSLGDIATAISRDKSTVFRELNRSKTSVYNVYLPHKADARDRERKHHSGRRPRLKNTSSLNSKQDGLLNRYPADFLMIILVYRLAMRQFTRIYMPKRRVKQSILYLV